MGNDVLFLTSFTPDCYHELLVISLKTDICYCEVKIGMNMSLILNCIIMGYQIYPWNGNENRQNMSLRYNKIVIDG